jgi:hypothetical protein
LIIKILIFSFTKVDYPFSHEILSFFAMMSWNFKMGVVKRPGQISQTHSAFIRTAQLILIEWAYQTPYDEIAEVFQTLKGGQTASYRATMQDEHHQGAPSPPEFGVIHQDWQKQLIKTNKAVIHFMRAYFHHESSTSLGTLLAHRVLALALSKQETGAYHEIIPVNNTTLMFKNITLSQEELVQLFQKSILQAGHLLFDDLLVQKDWGLELGRTLTLSFATEGENPHRTSRGWSFAMSPSMERFKDFVIKKVLNNKAIREQWFSTRTNRVIPSMANSYYGHLDRFLRILMVLIYMTSGAPARGTEVPTILHANSPANPRSIFLDKRTRLFLIRLRYSKTFSVTGQEQGALRVLPYAVSQLVLIYLVVILPFQQCLEVYMHETTTRAQYLPFYSKGRLLTSSNLSTTLIGLTNRLLGQSINISSFRHLIQAFVRYVMPPRPRPF